MVSRGLYCSVRHLIIVDDCLINLLIDKASHHNLHILNFKVAVYSLAQGYFKNISSADTFCNRNVIKVTRLAFVA